MPKITLKFMLDRIKGAAPKAYALELIAVRDAVIKAHLPPTPKEITKAVLADKGHHYPNLYGRATSVDPTTVIENARIGKVSQCARSIRTLLIAAQPEEQFHFWSVVAINTGLKIERHLVPSHEAMKTQHHRVQLARRHQLQERSGKLGVVQVMKFVALVTKKSWTPPPL